ncbi:MAG TPA: hypothetical protein VN368_01840, partial [Candidatus Methylomirabilis sp.]|nr:hypothetical protein [Candidatus Methylomirabilis sp.]
MIMHPPPQEKKDSFFDSSINNFFLFILVIYQNYRRSHYSKKIQIDADKKKIEIFPENEDEFNVIMEKLKGV